MTDKKQKVASLPIFLFIKHLIYTKALNLQRYFYCKAQLPIIVENACLAGRPRLLKTYSP